METVEREPCWSPAAYNLFFLEALQPRNCNRIDTGRPFLAEAHLDIPLTVMISYEFETSV